MKKIIFTFFALFFVYISKAQVTNVCASDSITLTVDNYVSGIVEWQESIDNINWTNIPEVSGVIYKFHPLQTKYYRALVITSGCDPLISAVSFVQLPPIAHAGEDRVIGNSNVTLLGNNILGATGIWTILSGSGGLLDDPTNPKAILTGESNETYQLKWTLTNPCGQSSDTVVIAFEGITVRKNFIIVDNTDKLLSDSTEMASGIYRIKFSDTTIAPYDSVMLIGMREDSSFLRRVTGFTQKDSVYSFSTVQGSLEDLIESGTLNLGDAVNQAMIGDTAHYKNSAAFPTRETLKNRTSKNGVELIYTKPFRDGNNNTLKSEAASSNPGGFKLPLPDITIGDNAGTLKYSIKDSYIKIDPNFVMDYHYKFPARLTDLKFGIDRGVFEYNYKTVLEGSVPFNFVKDKQTLLDFRQDMIIIVVGVPIWLTTHIKCNASCNIGISTALKIEQTKHYKKYLTALVTGDNVNNLSFNVNSNDETTVDEKMVIKGKLNAEVKIGPEISFTVDDIAGPYITVPLKMNTGICVNSDGNWDSETSLGIEGNIGAKGEIKALGATLTLFDFNYPLFDKINLGSYKMPNQLELLSGNFQSGIAGTKLAQPISVKVTNNHGSGIPLVPVRFESDNGNGSVSDPMLYTDSQGIVKTDWTLGSNPQNTLKVRVLNCSNSDIDNSPLIIYANSTTLLNNCTNSNLAINIRSASGNTYPLASGGKEPYTYSTNGVDYSSTIPQFPDNVAAKKVVYVKDKNQCIRSKTFEIIPQSSCANSTLYLDALIQPGILTLTGKLGKSPYTYSVDNSSSFSATQTYSKLIAGEHFVYVKDALGCVVSNEIVIEPQTTVSIQSSYPDQGAASVPVSGITFKWVAGNYATGQIYDLYLKKDNAAYSLIASDLNTTSFTYATALSNSGTYTWKVAVKGSNGVIDFNEFTFTTASGIATSPTVPVLLQPSNSSTSVAFPVTLKWTAQSGDYTYDVYLDNTDGSKLVALNLSSTEYIIDKLEFGKKYFWKVKIKSKVTGQSAFSNVWSFTTKPIDINTVTDVDGNVYHTVTIGTQVWMVENLKATKYNDGTSIPLITDNTAWGNLSSSGYCWYNNDAVNKNTYGALYNWFTANTTKLAPTGWHIPTDAEWTKLTDYLTNNGFGYQGSGDDIGKSISSKSGWNISTNSIGGAVGYDQPNNNSSGFTAVPGGYRADDGTFMQIGKTLGFWSSTDYSGIWAWSRVMGYENATLGKNDNFKKMGFSVRCIKDVSTNTLPTLNTTTVSNTTSISAISGGNVTTDGGSSVTSRGVCWSTSQNPTILDIKTTDGNGVGAFTSNITGLTPNTTYYVRAYAMNSAGLGYGAQVSFTTGSASSFVCGNALTIIHTIGSVAPETKTVSYGTVSTSLSGSSKCWITQNLGATNQASSATDTTAASAGWYWQFNRKQGYKVGPTPTWTINYIYENSDWLPDNDPCTIELGSGWRIPTKTEWTNNIDGWKGCADTYNSVLKIHAAGYLNGNPGTSGLMGREQEFYWSSTQLDEMSSWALYVNSISDCIDTDQKFQGLSIRCLKD